MWIDEENALKKLNRLRANNKIGESLCNDIRKIIKEGYTIIKSCIKDEIIDEFVTKYNIAYNNVHERVVNFHTHDESTLDLVCNKYIDKLLSTIFETKQTVYTSLTFGYGTNQSIHRDTPHFYTNPIDQYFGVWYALEDIQLDSGPLMYYKKGHTLDIKNGYETWNELFGNDTEKTPNNINLCLNKYNSNIEEECKKHRLEGVNTENITQTINKGDVIVWHPKLPHGGSNILNKELTRKSIVTHNIPKYKKVFNASHFFGPEHTREYLKNECFYKYNTHNNVCYVDHGVKHFIQKSYL
jgi:phytanoyl-CoA hydroxylase